MVSGWYELIGSKEIPVEKQHYTLKSDGPPSSLFQASSANSLIADEYLKDAKTPEEIRDGFTEIIGDLLMTLPVVMVAGYHSGQKGQDTKRTFWQLCE